MYTQDLWLVICTYTEVSVTTAIAHKQIGTLTVACSAYTTVNDWTGLTKRQRTDPLAVQAPLPW